MLLTNELELTSVALDPALDPSEPGVQLFEEGPWSCPIQHDSDKAIKGGRLQLQEIRYDSGG
jgi:hypothetical protein